MGDWKRYVNTTEAWAREVTDDVEDIVGSTGRTTAYRGDYIVNQSLRGQTFTYVLTGDDFADNWREPAAVDTDTTDSDTGDVTELPVVSTPGENDVDNEAGEPFGQVATVGTAAAEPSPADAPEAGGDVVPVSQDTADVDAPPSPTASAPTSAAPGDAATPAGNPPSVPDASPPAVSPVSGTATPVGPVEAPVGSAASEVTWEPPATVETATPAAEPATTTPTQTVEPSADVGGAGTATGEAEAGGVTSTVGTGGGDEGAAPTPTILPEGLADAPVEPATNTEPTAGSSDASKMSETGDATPEPASRPDGGVSPVTPPAAEPLPPEVSGTA